MMLVSLGSSSRGFAILVFCGDKRILLDCGIGAPTFKNRCAAVGIEPKVDYIFLTHGHGDHCGGAASVALAFDAKIIATRPTILSKAANRIRSTMPLGRREILRPSDSLFIGDIQITSFPVPHDKFNVGYVIEHDGVKLTSITDAGHVTRDILQAATDADILIIETNYHRAMLWDSDYPEHVKRRIDTPTGHLANSEAASMLEWLGVGGRGDKLKLVLGCHLGGNSNTPEYAERALRSGWERSGANNMPAFEILPRVEPGKIYTVDQSGVREREHADSISTKKV